MYEDLIKWLAFIELPIFAATFRMLIKNKREFEEQTSYLKESLSEFKLFVARNYVSTNYLKDVESRITNHLIRIEKKLDEVGRRK